MRYTIELVWNRSFTWSTYDSFNDLEQAKKSAISIRDSGDGARVKKVQIIDNDTNETVWRG